MGALWASWTCGVGSGMVISTVGTVGGGGGAGVGIRAKVALLGAGGVGASVLRFPVV